MTEKTAVFIHKTTFLVGIKIIRKSAAHFVYELCVELLIVNGRSEVDAPGDGGADKAAAARRVGQGVRTVGRCNKTGVTAFGGERAAVRLHGGNLALGYDVLHQGLAVVAVTVELIDVD